MELTWPDEPSEPPFPSYEEVQRDLSKRIAFTDAMRRLYWPLQGEFPFNMSAMKRPRAPTELEPLFQPGDSSNDDTWHEVASQPISRPRVSSISVFPRELDDWQANWKNYHLEHASPETNAEFIRLGDLDIDMRDPEADQDAPFLIRCCGEDRPLGKRGLTMTVTPSASGDFVTVKDYICGEPT